MKQIILKNLIILISSTLLIFATGCGDGTKDEEGDAPTAEAPMTEEECKKDDKKEWKAGEGEAEGECVDKVATPAANIFRITSNADNKYALVVKDECVAVTADQLAGLKVVLRYKGFSVLCNNTDDKTDNDCKVGKISSEDQGSFTLASTEGQNADCKALGDVPEPKEKAPATTTPATTPG